MPTTDDDRSKGDSMLISLNHEDRPSYVRTCNTHIAWSSARWYGEPKYHSERGKNLKVDLGLTIQDNEDGVTFLQIREVPVGLQKAIKTVIIFKCNGDTMRSAKKKIKLAWIQMQTSDESATDSLQLFIDIFKNTWTVEEVMPEHHGMLDKSWHVRR